MGSGNTQAALLDYAKAVKDKFPDLPGKRFEKAMAYGLKNVDWFGKLTFMAIAKFIREYDQVRKDKPWNPRA